MTRHIADCSHSLHILGTYASSVLCVTMCIYNHMYGLSNIVVIFTALYIKSEAGRLFEFPATFSLHKFNRLIE